VGEGHLDPHQIAVQTTVQPTEGGAAVAHRFADALGGSLGRRAPVRLDRRRKPVGGQTEDLLATAPQQDLAGAVAVRDDAVDQQQVDVRGFLEQHIQTLGAFTHLGFQAHPFTRNPVGQEGR